MSEFLPFIIGVAGESGAGKTTIANIIALYLGMENTLILSTDDLHRFNRNDPAWQHRTHPDPDMNNLNLGDEHLIALSVGNRQIWRSKYNHQTGYFDAPIRIYAAKYIIIEGLHAFYTPISQQLINLKIYVSITEDLAAHWKIVRDTGERGYTKDQVLQTIELRKWDNQHIQDQQLPHAELVIGIKPTTPITDVGNSAEQVKTLFNFKFNDGLAGKKLEQARKIAVFIISHTSDLNEFVTACQTIGNSPALCQDAGGNISVKKEKGYTIIKSSGIALKNVTHTTGYSVIETNGCNTILGGRPSMEADFHCCLPEKYVIHAHPVYLTLLLCLENSKEIIKEIFSSQIYSYIEYINPGKDLALAISKTRLVQSQLRKELSSVYLLENHGIIIQGNNMQKIIFTLEQINESCKKYIQTKIEETPVIFEESFKRTVIFSPNEILSEYIEERRNSIPAYFPDAAISDINNPGNLSYTKAANIYIHFIGSKIGTLRPLTQQTITELQNMEAEQYRQSL